MPVGSFSVNQVAVSPHWPADPFILVTGYDDQSRRSMAPGGANLVHSDLMRSSDGGATWERLEAPEGGVGTLHITPPTRVGRVIFGLGSDRSGGEIRSWNLRRSSDGGVTWTTVLNLPTSTINLQFSPAFADDGRAYLTHRGTLYNTQDYGATWREISPVPGQRVRQIQFSPAFAADRTVFAAVVTGSFPRPWGQENDARTAPHHETSAGIVRSTDGGATWLPASSGLVIDATPYRYVEGLAISPAYTQDGTLFALAWGPWTGDAVAAALFRSVDHGQTWTSVWQSAVGQSGVRWHGTFALAPSFGSDGVAQIALLGITIYQAGPHGTVDHGQTWNLVPRANYRSPGCAALRVTTGGPTGRLWYTLRYPGEGARAEAHRSVDDGASWQFFIPPASSFPGSGYWPYTIAPDGSFIVGTYEGLWMLPPPAGPPTSTPTSQP